MCTVYHGVRPWSNSLDGSHIKEDNVDRSAAPLARLLL